MSDRYKDFLDELALSYECYTFSIFPDIQCLWFQENSTLFVRGSDSHCDWLFNFLAWPEPFSDFHWGWAWQSHLIVDKCVELGFEPTTVVGHSSGGAMAQYVAFFYRCEAYSLSCPKTVLKNNKEFLSWADEKCVIINQEDDLVTKIPPWFIHPVEPLWLDTTDYPLLAHNLISFE